MITFAIDANALSHRSRLCLAGAPCTMTTNSPWLASILNSWHAVDEEDEEARGAAGLNMQIWVSENSENEDGEEESPPKRHFRGLHHIVTACFGSSTFFVFDLVRNTVTAAITDKTAHNVKFWNELVLPIVVGVMGMSVGVLPVHCACLSIGSEGLLIAGHSGAGKSSLAVALAQSGFDLVSDDWTYLGSKNGRLIARGMGVPVKLLPDALRHFPRLAQFPVRASLNGELAYEVAAADAFGASITRSCEPKSFVLLERTDDSGSEVVPLTSREVLRYLAANVERLPAQMEVAIRERAKLMNQMKSLPCWLFRYGGPPHVGAGILREHFLKKEIYECTATI